MNIINHIRSNQNIKKLLLVIIDFFILSISLSISFGEDWRDFLDSK